jgi:HrpA-like RNA helicase
MADFDPPEILQTPLEQVIIQLRSALHQEVIPALKSVISPPNMSHVNSAFAELHRVGFIENPDDEANLTVYGEMAAGLGIDFRIIQLIQIGIRLGIAKESCAMAATLSLDRSPFRQAHSLIFSNQDNADIINKVTKSMDFFSSGMASEPLMLIQVLYWFQTLKGGLQSQKKCMCAAWISFQTGTATSTRST